MDVKGGNRLAGRSLTWLWQCLRLALIVTLEGATKTGPAYVVADTGGVGLDDRESRRP